MHRELPDPGWEAWLLAKSMLALSLAETQKVTQADEQIVPGHPTNASSAINSSGSDPPSTTTTAAMCQSAASCVIGSPSSSVLRAISSPSIALSTLDSITAVPAKQTAAASKHQIRGADSKPLTAITNTNNGRADEGDLFRTDKSVISKLATITGSNNAHSVLHSRNNPAPMPSHQRAADVIANKTGRRKVRVTTKDSHVAGRSISSGQDLSVTPQQPTAEASPESMRVRQRRRKYTVS